MPGFRAPPAIRILRLHGQAVVVTPDSGEITRAKYRPTVTVARQRPQVTTARQR